jgi:hypothetical protein
MTAADQSSGALKRSSASSLLELSRIAVDDVFVVASADERSEVTPPSDIDGACDRSSSIPWPVLAQEPRRTASARQ